MKRLLTTLLLLIVTVQAGRADSPEMASFRKLWVDAVNDFTAGKNDEGLQLYVQLRSHAKQIVQQGHTDWELPYMMGTLQCLMPAKYTAAGRAMLADLLRTSRDIPPERYKKAEAIMQRCGALHAEEATPDISPTNASASVNTEFEQHPHVIGKGGTEDMSVASSRSIPAQISIKELQARVFPQDQGEKALASAISRIEPGAAGSLSNNFAVIDERGDQSAAQGVGECLGRYREALEQQFKLELPRNIVTVYEVKDIRTVIDEAAKLHGVALPFGTIAYSSFEDLSLVGVGSPAQCGSLAHEVVHLMMKYSIGNTPPWLEEGLASEVAVASAGQGNFKFGFSWRDDMLHARWVDKPRLNDLLNMGWNDFAAKDKGQLDRVAAIQAMAAVFIRYLAEKNKLTEVFFAVRNKHYSADFSQVQSYQKILEQSLGKSTDEIDRDFSSWFSREVERPQQTRTSHAVANEKAVQCAPGPQQECRPVQNQNMNTASPNAQQQTPPQM
ncbi:MAG TPA: hypothetical protein VGK21_14020 [Candidatus Angelobacter sp.]|jgi:hypothetical protein